MSLGELLNSALFEFAHSRAVVAGTKARRLRAEEVTTVRQESVRVARNRDVHTCAAP